MYGIFQFICLFIRYMEYWFSYLILIISLNMHFDEILLLYMIKVQIIKFSQYSLIYQLSHVYNYRYYDSIIKYFLN